MALLKFLLAILNVVLFRKLSGPQHPTVKDTFKVRSAVFKCAFEGDLYKISMRITAVKWICSFSLYLYMNE